VHDDGDNSKDQKYMNEKAAYMENRKSAQPNRDQNNCKDEKHIYNSFSVRQGLLNIHL
jgi:hypothetical protein